jgi:murein L,D-transpeptidase YcbB/YkuD
MAAFRDFLPRITTPYTAWVDNEGRLNFRDDVYRHDAELVKKMFVPAAAPAAER